MKVRATAPACVPGSGPRSGFIDGLNGVVHVLERSSASASTAYMAPA